MACHLCTGVLAPELPLLPGSRSDTEIFTSEAGGTFSLEAAQVETFLVTTFPFV